MNKKGLSSYNGGHYIFAGLILFLVILSILQFTKIPLVSIANNNLFLSVSLIFVYFLFSDFLDLLEPPSSKNHRGPLHSKTALLIYIVLIPVFIWKAKTDNIAYLYLVSIFCSMSVHLFGDSLTKNLSKI